MAYRWHYDKTKTDHDNRWDAFLAALKYFSASKGKVFSNFPGMTYDDVFNEIVARGFPMFNEKIDSGKWEAEKVEIGKPELTWFNLGMQVVLPCYSVMCEKFRKAVDIKKRTDSMEKPVPGTLERITVGDTIKAGTAAFYCSIKENERSHDYDNLWDYIESCEETGLPVSRIRFGEIVIGLDTRLPPASDFGDYADLLKMALAAKFWVRYSPDTRDWRQKYRQMLVSPPALIRFMSFDEAKRRHLTTEYLQQRPPELASETVMPRYAPARPEWQRVC